MRSINPPSKEKTRWLTTLRISQPAIRLDEAHAALGQQRPSLGALLHISVREIHQSLDMIHADHRAPGRHQIGKNVREIAGAGTDVEDARLRVEEGK